MRLSDFGVPRALCFLVLLASVSIVSIRPASAAPAASSLTADSPVGLRGGTDNAAPVPENVPPDAAADLNVTGVWTDSYGYTWSLVQKSGAIQGNVAVPCPNPTWAVAGSATSNTEFTLTATSPDGGDDTCDAGFTYDMTVTSKGQASGSWSSSVGGAGTVTMTEQSNSNLTIVSPANAENDTLSVDYTKTAKIPFLAKSPDSGSIAWNLNLTYSTSGGYGNYAMTLPSFMTNPGETQNEEFADEGGQLALTATQSANTAMATTTITGVAIPATTISAELLALYPGGATPALLEQIAAMESNYQQFYSETLYDRTALWPHESYDGGTHIGLMMVSAKLSTFSQAFNWQSNAEAGAKVFLDFLKGSAKIDMNSTMKKYGLPMYTPQMLEDEALSMYNVGNSKKLLYWTAGTDSNGAPIWQENTAGDPTGTAYADCVRQQTPPTHVTCQ